MSPLFIKVEFLPQPTAFVLMTVAYGKGDGTFCARYGQYNAVNETNVTATIREGFNFTPQRAEEYFPELTCKGLKAVQP